MSLILRCLAVVGALTYLASRVDGDQNSSTPMGRGKGQPWDVAVQNGIADAVSGSLIRTAAAARRNGEAAGLQGAGAPLLDRLMREAADGRIVQAVGTALSRDTLSSTDRQPAWRGLPGR